MKIINYLRKFHLITAVFGICMITYNDIYSQIIISAYDVSCHGCTDGFAVITVAAGKAPFEIIWPDGINSASHDNLASGVYNVSITDANGCNGSAWVTINNRPEVPEPFDITVVISRDPNDITGPAGYGEPKWVSINNELPYRVRFENDPKLATAPANKVTIKHPFDKNANMFSFCLGSFSFRGYTFEPPANTANYFKRLNLVDSLGVFIDVTAGIDVTQKQAFWIFQAIDPLTGFPNTDPEKGFILINDTITRMGEGEVNFSVKPVSNAATGDTVKAYADIIFDANENIRTNVAFNTIDARPPVSKIHSIKPISSELIKVSWNGNDDYKGSGLAKYKILVSANNGPYDIYAEVPDTTFTFNLSQGNMYSIQSLANDNTKNSEKLKPAPDTVIYLRPVVLLGKDLSVCINDSIELDAGSGFDSYLWNNGSEKRSVYVKTAGKYFVTGIKDTIVSSDTIIVALSQLPVPALHSNVSAFCKGIALALNAGSGYRRYLWNTSETTQTIEITNPGKYFVDIMDIIGCRASDTLVVTSLENPIFSLGSDLTVAVGDTTILSPSPGGFSSYRWNTNSTGSSLMVVGKQSDIGTKEFWLKVTDGKGCQNSDSISITFEPASDIQFIGDEITSIQIYPNPVSDFLNLEIVNAGYDKLNIELYTIDGKLLRFKQYLDNTSGTTDKIDMRGLSNGLYLLRATYKNKEITKTIIKQ